MSCLVASVALATNLVLGAAQPVVPTNATARQMIETCRTMIPSEVTLTGRIVLRNQRGITQAEYGYTLQRLAGETLLTLRDKAGQIVPFEKGGRLLKTDVTWSDLTLDYLWWDDFSFDTTCTQESVHGQKCAILLLKKGSRQVRVWVDRKTGALMQAEEFDGERVLRRLWGTRIKKFGDRWMAKVMEVETLGSGHRTKIIVDNLQ